MLATVPYALDIDVHGQVPDSLRSVNRISILAVHDTCVVEHDVDSTPWLDLSDHRLDLVLLGDIAEESFHLVGGWNELSELLCGGLEGWLGDIGHEDVGALFGEKNTGLETDAAMVC